MKTAAEIRAEIEALQWLASTCPNDAIAQASIAGQINVLSWVAPQEGASSSGGGPSPARRPTSRS